MFSQIISIIIFVVTIVLFVSRLIPGSVTAVLGCALFVIFGICSLEEAFSGFANSTVILIFGMMVVGIAVSETGLADLIGKKAVQISRHNERIFILLVGSTAALLATFLSNTAVLAIFLPLIGEISQANKKMNRMNVTLPIAMAVMYGGASTLIGSTPQLMANGILSEMNITKLNMFDLTLPGFLLFVVFMLYVMFIGYPLGKKIWGNRTNGESEAALQPEDTRKYDKKNMIIMAVILTAMIVFFVGGWIDVSLTAVMGAVLCIITGCVSCKSIDKKMNWSVLFMLAGCLGIATGITKGGAVELLGDALTKYVTSRLSSIWIFAVFVIVTMIVSNFVSNTSAVAITLPIALSVCAKQGLNSSLFVIGVVFAASLSYSSPLAGPQPAMTLVAGYRFSDYFRYTWLLNILVLLVVIFLFPLFIPLYS